MDVVKAEPFAVRASNQVHVSVVHLHSQYE